VEAAARRPLAALLEPRDPAAALALLVPRQPVAAADRPATRLEAARAPAEWPVARLGPAAQRARQAAPEAAV
jgi:hypothetical protein